MPRLQKALLAEKEALQGRIRERKRKRKRNRHGVCSFFFFGAERLCLPQTVEVAIGVYRLYLVTLADGEADGGLAAGDKRLSLVACLGLQGNPLNVVLGCHGVRDAADIDNHAISLHAPNGHVLFKRGVRRAGNEGRHVLSAAGNGRARFLDDCDDVAAVAADKEFLFHRCILSVLCFFVKLRIEYADFSPRYHGFFR